MTMAWRPNNHAFAHCSVNNYYTLVWPASLLGLRHVMMPRSQSNNAPRPPCSLRRSSMQCNMQLRITTATALQIQSREPPRASKWGPRNYPLRARESKRQDRKSRLVQMLALLRFFFLRNKSHGDRKNQSRSQFYAEFEN